MKTNNDFNLLRSLDIPKGTPKITNAESLDSIEVGDVILVEGQYVLVVSRSSTVETNKKFTKTKDYISHELLIRGILDTSWRGFLEYSNDDGLEIALSDSRAKMVGPIIDKVKDGLYFTYEGKVYYYDEDWCGIYSAANGSKSKVKIREYLTNDDEGGMTFEQYVDERDDDVAYETYKWKYISEGDVTIW